jgi:hypothetical protein
MILFTSKRRLNGAYLFTDYRAVVTVCTKQFIRPSRNPDYNLESHYPCSHVFDPQNDSKLLFRYPEGVMNYPVYHFLQHQQHNISPVRVYAS